MDNECTKDLAEVKATLANMQKSIDTILKALNDNKLAEMANGLSLSKTYDVGTTGTEDAALYYTELNNMSTQACNI